MIARLRFVLLAVGVVFASLSFAQDPPAQPDDPPVRLKKKNKPDAEKPDTEKPTPAKPPMKDDKKTPPKKEDGKEEPEPAQPQEDEAEVLNRVAKNVRMAEEKIANKELGDNTRQLQEDILKDLDSLIQAAENPPQGGGGGGGGGDDKQDQPNDPKANSGKSGSMGQQPGKQGSGSGQGSRSMRAQRRHQGNGTQQANKGGKPNGSGQPMPGMGEGNQGNQQASGKSGGNNGGGGANTSKEGENPNADLYKEAWGHLPPALRAEMMAYSNDKQFMAKYDELIKRYYRSIAEEGRKKGGN